MIPQNANKLWWVAIRHLRTLNLLLSRCFSSRLFLAVAATLLVPWYSSSCWHATPAWPSHGYRTHVGCHWRIDRTPTATRRVAVAALQTAALVALATISQGCKAHRIAGGQLMHYLRLPEQLLLSLLLHGLLLQTKAKSRRAVV